MATPSKIRNVGPKGAAWLRQVGIRTEDEVKQHGAMYCFMKVKRAGFKPSLNLLYALAGAERDCHWQAVPEDVRAALLAEHTALEAAMPKQRRSSGFRPEPPGAVSMALGDYVPPAEPALAPNEDGDDHVDDRGEPGGGDSDGAPD